MLKKIVLMVGVIAVMSAKEQTIVFGAGCFWGVESYFSNLKGVKDSISGYAGGNYPNPTYETVLKYRNRTEGNLINHTESVKVIYNTEEIGTEELIKKFWELHDPTQGDKQGNDIGNNYRSAIFYTTDEQKEIALSTKDQYQKRLSEKGYGKITTEIKRLDRFYDAEKYHQNYLQKNPNGYCPNHATGVKFEKERENRSYIEPLGGKEIVVKEAESCRYCELFKRDVVSEYRGTVPLRMATELKNFKIETKLDVTPIVLFIEDGKEVFSFKGYMSPKDFYRAVGIFKLGENSEAYRVAFEKGTDSRFCKQYDIFKDTPDGVFVDRLSGDILFDTRDKFNSHSGWLSFYKAVDDAVVFKEDNSYGMHRIEVLAKRSGMHLGHIFDDAPGGRNRFCINATVLEFVPRDKIKK